MQSLVLLIWFIGNILLAQGIIMPDDSSGKSGVYVVFSPVYTARGSEILSENSSEASNTSQDTSKTNDQIVKEVYNHYEKMAGRKNIIVKEVISEFGIEKYGLNEYDIVELDKTRIGLLVSSDTRVLFLIPSKMENIDLTVSKER